MGNKFIRSKPDSEVLMEKILDGTAGKKTIMRFAVGEPIPMDAKYLGTDYNSNPVDKKYYLYEVNL